MEEIVPIERIEQEIYLLRGKKIMLDKDLAKLYGVKTQILNQAVKRNQERFPEDFMFLLTRQEIMRVSQIVIPSNTLKFSNNVHAFTENGIAMLSSVLNSKRAIFVNIQIMRTFTKLREILATHKDLREKIEKMEKKYDYQFKAVFDAIKALIEEPAKGKKKFGFV